MALTQVPSVMIDRPLVTIASATTTDIGASASENISVTGTTTITGLGTVAAGAIRTVTFAAALTLTYNATSLILPGSASITTAAGDVATFISLGSGNWRCVNYVKASGQAVQPMLVAGTAQASTSGTSIDFTSIPSGVKRITVMFNSVSTSGTSVYQVRFGVSGIVSSGYSCTGVFFLNSGAANIGSYSAGFPVALNVAAANSITGTLILENMGSNIWVATGLTNVVNGTYTQTTTNGSITLTGSPDTLRITTVNGTDTFDAGSINILYE